MKTNFIIHDRMFDSEERIAEAVNVLKNNNCNPIFVEGHYFEPENERLIKSLKGQTVKGLLPVNWARNSGIVGLGASPLDFHVTNYLKHFPEYFLNQDCVFYPFWSLKVDLFKNQIFKKFSYSDRLFVKPDSGFKTFTGFPTNREQWDKDIELLNFVNENSIVLISSYKEIVYEWRFWIIGGELITYSPYSWEGQEEKEPENFIIETAKLIAGRVKHLKNFTLDLCIEKGNIYPKVVEINCVNTSGVYNCDLNKLIPAMIGNKNEN